MGINVTETKELLVFNVYTGELKPMPLLKEVGPTGKWQWRATYDPNEYLPVCLGFIPRYDIEGNYIGFTNDDSGEIKKFNDPEEIIAKGTLKLLRNWLLIGTASIILFVITLLLIYYDIGSHTLMQILVSVQFALMIVAAIYYIILLKFKKQVIA